MIGKSANMRCFENVKKSMSYDSNTNACMTLEIFEKWLVNMNKNFGKPKREIGLFIDKVTIHNSIPKQKNVKVVFLLDTIIPMIQPMNHGIIKNPKPTGV